METRSDSRGVTQETFDGERKGNQIGLPGSPTCPLTSSLSPSSQWGIVGQRITRVCVHVASLAAALWSSPSYTA